MLAGFCEEVDHGIRKDLLTPSLKAKGAAV